MSIQAYVKKAGEGLQKKISENIEYAKSNPYPVEDLDKAVKSIGETSALAKIYGPSGEKAKLSTFPPDAIAAAMDEAKTISPTLWGRLDKGQKGLNKLKSNETVLSKLDLEKELRQAYSQALSNMAGTELTMDELLKSSPEEFGDVLMELDINTYGAGGLVQEAFKEIHSQPNNEKTGSQINSEEPPITKTEGPSSVINQEESNVKSESPVNEPINDKSNSPTESATISGTSENVSATLGELIEPVEESSDLESSAISINLESTEPVVLTNESIIKEASGGGTPINEAGSEFNQNTFNEFASQVFNQNTNNSIESIESNSKVNSSEVNDNTSSVINSVQNSEEYTQFSPSESNRITNTVNADLGSGQSQSSVLETESVTNNTLDKTLSNSINSFEKDLFSNEEMSIQSLIEKMFSINQTNSLQNNESFGESREDVSNMMNSENNSSILSDNVEKISESSSLASFNESDRTIVDRQNVSLTKPTIQSETSQNTTEGSNTNVSMATTSYGQPTQVTPGFNSETSVSNQTSNSSQTTNNSTSSESTSSASPGQQSNLSELASAISRLERILLSGLEVTIKDN